MKICEKSKIRGCGAALVSEAGAPKAPCLNLWLIFLLAALCGCGGHSGSLDQLESAQAVMEEHPDSALAILAQIDTASLSSPRERALYGLYLTNARYLAYDPAASDSLLSANSAYLASAPSAYDRMLYHYLSGVFQSEDSLFSSALPNLLQSAEFARDLKDPLHMGRIHRTIGDLYNSLFIDKQALKYHLLALEDFIIGKEDKFVGWQKWTVAQSYFNLGLLDSCYIQLHEILSDPVNSDNFDIKNATFRLLGAARKKEEKYEEAITSIRSVSEPLNPRDNYILGYSWLKLGNLDSAKFYFELLPEQSSEFLTLQYLIKKRENDLPTALSSLENSFTYEVGLSSSLIKDNILGIESQYFENQKELSEIRQRTSLVLFVCLIIVILTIAILLLLIQRRSIALKRIEIENFILKTEDLQKEINEREEKGNHEKHQYNLEIKRLDERRRSLARQLEKIKDLHERDVNKAVDTESKLKLKIEKLREERLKLVKKYEEASSEVKKMEQERDVLTYKIIRDEIRGRYELINDICGMLYDESRDNKPRNEKALIRKFQSKIKELEPSTENTQRLENLSNQLYANVIDDFKRECPSLYKSHGLIFLYKTLGLPTRTIAYLLGVNDKYVYDATYRLKKGICEIAVKNKPRFLSFFE